jgi:hypothetical protein
VTALVAVALAVGGLAWIVALSTLNSLYQLTLPQWVKARGMSFYLVVFQGGAPSAASPSAWPRSTSG